MISYPFILDLSKNILSKSRAIDGRFFICPNMGREMNSDELGKLIEDVVVPQQLEKKYPLALMMPPSSYGYYTNPKGEWERYRGMLFFLTTSFYNNGKIVNPNVQTGTSMHRVDQDWHDMKRAAVNFVVVLSKVSRSNFLISNKFRLDQDRECVITPISNVGVDKASGVRLDLFYSCFVGCDIEDYNEDDISDIKIPEDDSHPEHAL